MSESMVKFVPYNRCLECGGLVVAIETETNIIALDKTGMPISTENFSTESKLLCTECGHTSPVNIINMRYIEKSNVVPIIRRRKNPFGYTEKN